MLAHPGKNTVEFVKAEVSQFSNKMSESMELERVEKASSTVIANNHQT